jgi:hypothetical protein
MKGWEGDEKVGRGDIPGCECGGRWVEYEAESEDGKGLWSGVRGGMEGGQAREGEYERGVPCCAVLCCGVV